MRTVEEIRARIEASKARSAWARGVKEYANMILDTIEEAEAWNEEPAQNVKELERRALNGARSWREASEGGCFLIYDMDIARTLCNPSELKRTDGGRKEPNPRESWLDVQTRAIRQAWYLVEECATL